MDYLARLREAVTRAVSAIVSEARGRMGGAKPKKPKARKRPPTTTGRPVGPGADVACGTGKGGFAPGNQCAKEDGVKSRPFSKGGALKQQDPKALMKEADRLQKKIDAKKKAAPSVKQGGQHPPAKPPEKQPPVEQKPEKTTPPKRPPEKKPLVKEKPKQEAAQPKPAEKQIDPAEKLAAAKKKAEEAEKAAKAKEKESQEAAQKAAEAKKKAEEAEAAKKAEEQKKAAEAEAAAKQAEADKKKAEQAAKAEKEKEELKQKAEQAAKKAAEAKKKAEEAEAAKKAEEQKKAAEAEAAAKQAEADKKKAEQAAKKAAEDKLAAAHQKELEEAKQKAAEKTAEIGKPAPYKRPDAPLPPQPEATTPAPKDLKVVSQLGGSTGASLAVDSVGNKFVIKSGSTAAHIKSESQADELYRAAGVNVPKQQVHDTPDGPKKVAEYIDGKTLGELKDSNPKQYDAAVKRLRKDFVADVLLGNRDVVGMNLDNIVVGKGGKVFRVDNGGSLTFRAQGKEKDFGPDVSKEIDGLRNPAVNASAAGVFGGITNKEISAQITSLTKKKETILAAAKTPELRAALEKRFDSLLKWQKQNKANVKSASVAVKSFGVKKHTNQSPEYFSQSLRARIDEMAKKGEFSGESGVRVLQSLRTGVTTSAMTDAERNKVVDVVWGTMSSGERAAVHKWGSNSWTYLRDKMKNGQYDDPEVKSLVSGLKKMPVYRSLVSRDMQNISEAQMRSWIDTKSWNTAFPTNPSNTTAASFSTFNKAQVFHSQGASFSSGDVTVVCVKPKSIVDTANKMPYYTSHPHSEREAISPHTAKYKVLRHYWLLSNSHDLVKAGVLSVGIKYSESQIKNAYKKKKLKHPSIFQQNKARLVLEVEEI